MLTEQTVLVIERALSLRPDALRISQGQWLCYIEFNLLALLMKNRGIALDHANLLRTIWGPEPLSWERVRVYAEQCA